MLWSADVGMLWLLECSCSSRRRLAAGMLSRWQAAPSWALLANSGSTDAAASPQRISFLGTWLCCCMSGLLQNFPLGQQTLPAPFRTARVPCRGRGDGGQEPGGLAPGVSDGFVAFVIPPPASQERGLSSSAGKHSKRPPQGFGREEEQGDSRAEEERSVPSSG